MIPYGYKRTEVGVIPDDWDVRKIGDFTDITAGGTPSTSHPEYWNGEIPWMSSGELNNRRIHNVIGRITELGYNNSSTHMIPKNCVLIGLAGQGKTRGTVAVNYVELCTNQSIAAIFPSKEHNSEYLYQNLRSRYEELRELSSGDGGRGGLNLTIIKNFSCAFPKLQEQNRIAEALSDVDELISSLEKLIAKKKAVKQGTMQELLTGKKRLPGFAGEWAHMELGKYGSLMKETINPQLYSSEYFWEYSMPAFDEGRTPIKQKGADMHSNRTVICGKVLLFNKLNVRQKRVWLIDQCRDSAVCSSEFLPYKSDAINLELLSQILYTDKVTLEFIGMSTGTSNSQKRITPDAFLEYKVYLPVNEKEQAAIANVFSCMDNEIEALEQKLEKTSQIKQGMMQQLLTGKIRLV